jgi:nucleoid-associated protein YgaU
MARKSTKKTEQNIEEAPKNGVNFFDYLRFGESYTSLILGIIVVVISTALLLSFVHNRNTNNAGNPQQGKNVAQGSANYQISSLPTLTPIVSEEASATVEPTEVKKTEVTAAPTKAPVVTPSKVPTLAPTHAPTVMPTKQPEPTVTPKTVTVSGGEYIVKSGDTLWSIAENHYKSGYNWVDIARANKLSNPGAINAGNKLILPKVAVKAATVVAEKGVVTNDEQNNSTIAKPSVSPQVSNKITGDTYKIVRGDTLWDIAVRAYGDGYKWVDIARANGYTNPSLIHADNVLKIPRNK